MKARNTDLDCDQCQARCPELLDGNLDVWRLLQAGITQMRVSAMGGTIGFDYVALKLLADTIGIDVSPGLWTKVRAVENVIRSIEAKRAKEQSHSSVRRK